MSKIKYRSFYDKEVTPDIMLKARNELGETPEIRKRCLEELKQMIAKEKDFDCFMDDKFLLSFLRYRKFNTERSFKSLCAHYKYRLEYRDVFYKYTLNDLKNLIEMRCINIGPYRNENNESIFYVQLGNLDFSKSSIVEAIALTVLGFEAFLSSELGQICGLIIVVDMKGVPYRMFWEFTPYVYAYVKIFQDSFPLRIKGYHVLNAPLFGRVVFNTIKSILNEKLKKRLFMHGNDTKKLHRYISPALLPVEFGGVIDTSDTKESIEYIIAQQNLLNRKYKHGYKN